MYNVLKLSQTLINLKLLHEWIKLLKRQILVYNSTFTAVQAEFPLASQFMTIQQEECYFISKDSLIKAFSIHALFSNV